jgi:hypothetical protein
VGAINPGTFMIGHHLVQPLGTALWCKGHCPRLSLRFLILQKLQQKILDSPDAVALRTPGALEKTSVLMVMRDFLVEQLVLRIVKHAIAIQLTIH